MSKTSFSLGGSTYRYWNKTLMTYPYPDNVKFSTISNKIILLLADFRGIVP